MQRKSKPIKTISNFFPGSVLCICLIPRLNIHCFKLQRLSTRQQHLHFAVWRRGRLPSALLHCLGLVRGGMGGGGRGGVAVLSIVCKFLPVFCCCVVRDVHVGISERCQQTTLLLRHARTHAHGSCAAARAYLCSARHSGTVPQPRVHKPHSNTDRKISSSGTT